jgi:hypothetical protein
MERLGVANYALSTEPMLFIEARDNQPAVQDLFAIFGVQTAQTESPAP